MERSGFAWSENATGTKMTAILTDREAGNANMGLNAMVGEAISQAFVLSTNLCSRFTGPALKLPPR